MESVRWLAAMRRGIGQGIDDLQLLDDGAGPSVRDDERQRVFVRRTNVNEMNVDPIDLGDEIRQRVESCLNLAPVVLRCPIARELLHRRELHALRCIGFPVRPPRGVDAPSQVIEFRLRNVHAKWANHGGVTCLVDELRGCTWRHDVLLLMSIYSLEETVSYWLSAQRSEARPNFF